MLGPDEVLVASVNGVFGVKGEVRLFVHDRQSRTLAKPVEAVLISPEGVRRTVTVTTRSGAGKRIIATISGIESPEVAHGFIGWNIVVPRSVLPPTQKDEYYIHDLLDLPVVEDGVVIGKLSDVVNGARDVWVIETPTGEERYVLASAETILSVDLATGIVIAAGSSALAE